MDQLIAKLEKFETLVVSLNIDWKLQNDLFSKNEHIEAFNQAAPAVWEILRNSLLDSVLMGISRLMDPPRSCGKENVSLKTIADAVPNGLEKSERALLSQLEAQYRRNIKIWRNKRLSHNDLETIQGITSIPDLEISEIDQFIVSLNKSSGAICSAGGAVETEFVPITSAGHWVPKLLTVLKKGQ